MAYRPDPDLEFLQFCSSEDLEELVHFLTFDKDHKPRMTEGLTSNNNYKRYYPNHQMYWQEIAEEIQRFGGNTVSNLFRMGKGVLYREILCDVCKKMKVEYQDSSSTKEIELELLEKIIEKTLSELSREELESIANELNIPSSGIPKSVISAAILKATHSYLASTTGFAVINTAGSLGIVTATVGQMISNTVLGRILGVATGPVGWLATTAWMINDIASPATRITIPAVIKVACLRLALNNKTENEFIGNVNL